MRELIDNHLGSLSRRSVLAAGGVGLGRIALGSLLGDQPTATRPHHRPLAKNVIYLGMIGAPSQIDLFEDLPELDARDGQPVPESILEGQRFVFIGQGKTQLLASPWKKAQHGANGTWLSELLPHHRKIADRVTWIHSMVTDEINHVPAQLFLQTGSPRMGRPAMGSWVWYGLGTDNRDLPGYVVLASGKAGRCGSTCWGSGFLPSQYQGVQLRTEGEPVLFLDNPDGIDARLRRRSLDTLRALNEERLGVVGDPEIAARIEAFELAFRMQASVPDLVDFKGEDAQTLAMYGAEPGRATFANNCLLARRLVERGVRFVQLIHGGWDHHGGGGDQNLVTNLPQRCGEIDQGAAALILDLERRGMLDDTLVVWGGEFGRTPMLQGGRSATELGRDHLRTAFTIWMAGGGVRQGLHHGELDDFGMNPTSNPVHVHDLQATILHLLGMDHERLTFRFQGRDFRLTDVAGNVVRDLIA